MEVATPLSLSPLSCQRVDYARLLEPSNSIALGANLQHGLRRVIKDVLSIDIVVCFDSCFNSTLDDQNLHFIMSRDFQKLFYCIGSIL